MVADRWRSRICCCNASIWLCWSAGAAAPADQQSQIDALQQQIRDLQRSATMDTPPANAAATAEPQRTQPS